MKKSIFVLLSFMLVVSLASAETRYSIGLSPNYADFGEVLPGSSHSVTFKILSQSTDPVLVYMEGYGAGIDTIKAKQSSMVSNFSEESTDSWATFIRNPVEMEASEEGKRSSEDFTFFVNIPKDAEPGYHAIMLRPSIYVPEENMGRVGSRVIGVTSFMAGFYVKGNANRSGIILDTVKSGYSGSRIEFSTYFQNTGSVTLYAKARVSSGSAKGESSSEKVGPQEIKVLKSYISLSELSCSDCQLKSIVDYYTGTAESETQFSITGPVQVLPTPSVGIDLTIIIIAAILLLAALFVARRFLNGE